MKTIKRGKINKQWNWIARGEYDRQFRHLEGIGCSSQEENETTSNNTLRRFLFETQDILDDNLTSAHKILDALTGPSDSLTNECTKLKPDGMVEHSEMIRNKADELNYVLNKIDCMLGI